MPHSSIRSMIRFSGIAGGIDQVIELCDRKSEDARGVNLPNLPVFRRVFGLETRSIDAVSAWVVMDSGMGSPPPPAGTEAVPATSPSRGEVKNKARLLSLTSPREGEVAAFGECGGWGVRLQTPESVTTPSVYWREEKACCMGSVVPLIITGLRQHSEYRKKRWKLRVVGVCVGYNSVSRLPSPRECGS
jgi:hypothetical protein